MVHPNRYEIILWNERERNDELTVEHTNRELIRSFSCCCWYLRPLHSVSQCVCGKILKINKTKPEKREEIFAFGMRSARCELPKSSIHKSDETIAGDDTWTCNLIVYESKHSHRFIVHRSTFSLLQLIALRVRSIPHIKIINIYCPVVKSDFSSTPQCWWLGSVRCCYRPLANQRISHRMTLSGTMADDNRMSHSHLTLR